MSSGARMEGSSALARRWRPACRKLATAARDTYLSVAAQGFSARKPGPVVNQQLMITITFIASDGTSFRVEAEPGTTLMENAIRNAVPGIEAECGGACACATCHVYVDEAWSGIVGDPGPMEEDMLDFGYDVRANSRLSCQIRITDALDGLIVRVPERQA
jgi:2Fe-2S ferredoxin